jgi:hypothetical protein
MSRKEMVRTRSRAYKKIWIVEEVVCTKRNCQSIIYSPKS